MYAFDVLTTLLRAPRLRAYNLSRYKSLPSYSLSLARTGCGHKMRPRRGHYRGLPPAECGAKIIIRHAPRLQGETFTGLSQHQRIFPNVASEHHFLCLLRGDWSVAALATVKGLVLVNVFTNLALINVP